MSDKPRGRPREFDGMISVRVSAALEDALHREAQARGIETAAVIRERLDPHFVSRKLTPPKNPAD